MFFYIDTNRTKEPLFSLELEYVKSRSHGSHRSHRLYMTYMTYMTKKSYTSFQNLCLTLSKSMKNNSCLYDRQIVNLKKNDRFLSDLKRCLK